MLSRGAIVFLCQTGALMELSQRELVILDRLFFGLLELKFIKSHVILPQFTRFVALILGLMLI